MLIRYTRILSIITMLSGMIAIGSNLRAQSLGRQRIEKIRQIKVMAGNWELNTTMIPLNAPRISEKGSMHCSIVFDSTYVECQVELTNERGQKRSYRQFTTYNPQTAQYEILYLYSGSPMRILEFGEFANNELRSKTTIKQSNGSEEIIQTLLRMSDPNNLYFESRSSVTKNEIDYTCTYKRVN